MRAQRRDVEPARDLWPGIAARLPAQRPAPSPWAPRFALAASLAVATGTVLLLRLPATPGDEAARQASVVVREYDQAMKAMPKADAPAELAPAMVELDRSARDIRHALKRDPDSRLLLDQLRRTYSLRLALSQRAVVG
ncbi:hypothetical protein PAGU2595_015790 [Lysobacter xanthus]